MDEKIIPLPSWKHNILTSKLVNTYSSLKFGTNKKYIFVSTTGRSGTTTLTKIFDACNSVSSFHEPYPIMNGSTMNLYNKGSKKRPEQIFKYIKVPNIHRETGHSDFYFESNHMFIKSYVEFSYQYFGKKMAVIHLRRDPLEVADSIISIQNEPGTTEGDRWWLSYSLPNNLIKISNFLDSFHGIEASFLKALWYWYEIEARTNYWKRELPEIDFYTIETPELNQIDKVLPLLDSLGVKYDYQSIENIVGKKFNLKQNEKTLRNVERDRAIELHDELLSELINQDLLRLCQSPKN
jgi:hypothetical protein